MKTSNTFWLGFSLPKFSSAKAKVFVCHGTLHGIQFSYQAKSRVIW